MVLNRLTPDRTIQCWTGQVYALLVVNDAAPVRCVSVLNYILHDRCEGNREVVRLLNAEAYGQAALWVCVDEKHTLTHIRKSYTEVDSCGRLSNATFLIGDGDHFTLIHCGSSFLK
jgi:hypothetical protein